MDNQELLNAIADLLAKELGEMRDEIKELNAKVDRLETNLSGQIADSVVTLTEYFGEEINKTHKRIGEVDTIATAALKGTVLLGGTLTKQ